MVGFHFRNIKLFFAEWTNALLSFLNGSLPFGLVPRPATDHRSAIWCHELLQPKCVEIGGEIFEKIALKRIIAIAVHNFATKLSFVVFHLLFNIWKQGVELHFLSSPWRFEFKDFITTSISSSTSSALVLDNVSMVFLLTPLSIFTTVLRDRSARRVTFSRE